MPLLQSSRFYDPGIQYPHGIFKSESESESALFAKCVQTHEEFVVVFKKLLVHTYIHTYISDMRTEHLNKP